MPTPRRVLVPLPSRDFDPTEAAVPWKRLTDAGHDVVFATPRAQPAQADPIMLSGVGLWLWKPLLRAEPYGVACYEQMVRSAAFCAPVRWDAVDADEYHALLLPGGHAKGMREYLESAELQAVVARFFAARRPVGAICHGTLLAARSISPLTGKSVLHGLKSTGLQRRQEWAAYLLTALYMGKYYRTYDVAMETELRSFLADPANDYLPGPLPLKRDSPNDLSAGFTLLDANYPYLSARWPGDANKFAADFLALIEGLKE